MHNNKSKLTSMWWEKNVINFLFLIFFLFLFLFFSDSCLMLDYVRVINFRIIIIIIIIIIIVNTIDGEMMMTIRSRSCGSGTQYKVLLFSAEVHQNSSYRKCGPLAYIIIFIAQYR